MATGRILHLALTVASCCKLGPVVLFPGPHELSVFFEMGVLRRDEVATVAKLTIKDRIHKSLV